MRFKLNCPKSWSQATLRGGSNKIGRRQRIESKRVEERASCPVHRRPWPSKRPRDARRISFELTALNSLCRNLSSRFCTNSKSLEAQDGNEQRAAELRNHSNVNVNLGETFPHYSFLWRSSIRYNRQPWIWRLICRGRKENEKRRRK